MDVVVGASVAGSLLVLSFALLMWKLLSSIRVRGVDPDWLQKFSTDFYQPMERLLSEDDIEFLKAQPGYEPGMEKMLRAERRKVFRAYLRTLGQDFNRLHLALRLIVLYSPEDRPDLAGILLRQKALFLAGLLAAHARLALYGVGVDRVDVRGLVATLDTMRADVQAFLGAPAANTTA